MKKELNRGIYHPMAGGKWMQQLYLTKIVQFGMIVIVPIVPARMTAEHITQRREPPAHHPRD